MSFMYLSDVLYLTLTVHSLLPFTFLLLPCWQNERLASDITATDSPLVQ